MLCQKAHEECGSSWNGELPKETIGYIQSAGYLGQKEVVAAAHNACIRERERESLYWINSKESPLSGSCYKKPMCTGRRIVT